MGCVIASACASEKDLQKTLIVERSPNNIQGISISNSFINYVKYRELVLKTSIIEKEDMYNCICIKYKTYNECRTIYNGTELTPMIFDELYRKIIIMND